MKKRMDLHFYEVEFATPQYDETVRLRNRVLRQPLGLQFYTKDFQKEYLDTHLACYNERNQLVACLVLTALNDTQVKMRQVAVDAVWQGKGIGQQLVAVSETLSRRGGFLEMILNARANAIPFYEKLGYQKIGKPFTEVTIEHYKMIKKLDVC